MNKSYLILNFVLAVFLTANAFATREGVNNRHARIFKPDESLFQKVEIMGRVEAANSDGYGASVTGGSALANLKVGERVFIPLSVLSGTSLKDQQTITITGTTKVNQNTPFGSMKVVASVDFADLKKVPAQAGATFPSNASTRTVDSVGRVEAANPDGYGISIMGGNTLSNLKTGERLFIPAAVLNGKSLNDKQIITITQVTNGNQNTPFGLMKVVTGVDLQKVIKKLGDGRRPTLLKNAPPSNKVDAFGYVEQDKPEGYYIKIAGGSDLSGLGSAEYVFVPVEILKSKQSDRLPSNPYSPTPLEIIITQVTKQNQNTPFGSAKVATGIIFDASQSNNYVLE